MHDLRQRHCPISTPTQCKKRVGSNYAELWDLRRALYSRQTHGDFGINHGSATAYEISNRIAQDRGRSWIYEALKVSEFLIRISSSNHVSWSFAKLAPQLRTVRNYGSMARPIARLLQLVI